MENLERQMTQDRVKIPLELSCLCHVTFIEVFSKAS